jgi:hypothetical protein
MNYTLLLVARRGIVNAIEICDENPVEALKDLLQDGSVPVQAAEI